MQFPSSPLATAGQQPDRNISTSNAPEETSFANGVINYDPPTHDGPQCDSGASKKSFKAKKKADAVIVAAEDSADDNGQHLSSSRNGTVSMRKRIRSASRSSEQIKKKFPDPWMAEIVPGLVLGDLPASICPGMLQENHINAMVSLYQCVCSWQSAMLQAEKPADRHIFIRCEDSLTVDLLVYMGDICDFIDKMASPALQLSSTPLFSALPPLESILVHCEAGRSRSPTIIIAYLMRKYCMEYTTTLEFVKTKRRVNPNPNFKRQLQIWEEVGYNIWVDDKRRIPKAPYQAYLDYRAGIMDRKQDLDAITNAKTALESPYPIGPKFEPPYCCEMVDNCPCKD